MKRTASVERVLDYNVTEIWNKVTNNREYSWRSDIQTLEIISDTQFIEHTKDGAETTFTIVEKEPNSLYVFNMENKLFSGRWVGQFTQLSDSATRIAFKEEIEFNHLFVGLMSYLLINLKKIQSTYIQDLEGSLKDDGR